MGDGYDDHYRLATRRVDPDLDRARSEARRRRVDPFVHAKLARGRIVVTGWLGGDTPELYRQVGGGRFLKEPYAHWSFSADPETCTRLLEVFSGRIRLSGNLRDWAARLGGPVE